MFIAKTTFDKKALVALQDHLAGSTRTHDNDLVALCYLFDKTSNAHDILCQSTIFDTWIRYTFFWTFEYAEYSKYQHPGVWIVVHKMYKDDETPVWGCFFEATLRTWLEYCHAGHPQKFVEIIKKTLTDDGYTLRLRRTNVQS